MTHVYFFAILAALGAGPPEPFPAAPPLSPALVSPAPAPEPPAHAAAPAPALSADHVVDCWRVALGLDPPTGGRAPVADRPAAKPAPKPARAVRAATRAAAPARSWRIAPDNSAVELYTDGRTYTAWRYRAGFAPPPVMAAPPVAYQPAYGFGGFAGPAFCPPGGS